MTLQVTDGAGCVSTLSDAFNIVVNPYPTAIITVNDTQLTASAGDGYQWYQNGSKVSGANSQSIEFNFLEYGIYKVDVMDNGCTSTSNEFEYLITGVENFANELKLFPNPIEENIFVEFTPPYSVYILDVTGKVIYRSDVETKSTTIDLTDLANGIYLVHIKNEKETRLLRISKQ